MNITWQASYNDGTVLNQYNEDNSVNKYTDIDRTRLVSFKLVVDEWKPIFTIHLEEGQNLIFRRRVFQNMSTGEDFVIYLAGWQQNVNGRNIQSIAYIFEDGHIELAGSWKEGHKWFYAPNLIDAEKV